MRLIETAATFDETLPSGVTVTLRSLSGPLYQAARMAAATRARDGEAWPEGLDRTNEAHRLGVGLAMLNEELARLGVVGWSDVEDADGAPLDCTPDNAARLAHAMPHDGAAIHAAVTRRVAPSIAEDEDEGNGSRQP